MGDDFMQYMGTNQFDITDEDQFCFRQGRRNALTKAYENLWKDYFEARPTFKMAELEGLVEAEKYKTRKTLCLLTLNPKPDADTYEFEDWVESIKKRSWVGTIHAMGWEETDNKERTPHVHMCFSLKKNYSPAQIRATLYQGLGKKHFGCKKAIHPIKGPLRDLKNMVKYCTKGEFEVEYKGE